MGIKIATLGPKDTCHANALEHFIQFQEIKNAQIIYIEDFIYGAEILARKEIDLLVQNISHPTAKDLCTIYRGRIYIVDSFIYPAKEMGILHRKQSNSNYKLGLMPATEGYLDKNKWVDRMYETSNPKVCEGLIKGKYEYGVTFLSYAYQYSDILEISERFGEAVDAAWIVYANKRAFDGKVIGIYHPTFYQELERRNGE